MWGPAGFVPIGAASNSFSPFTGMFDGQGNTISGLKIAPTVSSINNIGLFASNAGTIQNLTLTNVDVSANPTAGDHGRTSARWRARISEQSAVFGSTADR